MCNLAGDCNPRSHSAGVAPHAHAATLARPNAFCLQTYSCCLPRANKTVYQTWAFNDGALPRRHRSSCSPQTAPRSACFSLNRI